MKVDLFDYALDPRRIAQRPAEPRDAARLLVHARDQGTTRHLRVGDLPQVLRAGDLLVVNDTRVRWARLLGRRSSGGAVELLLLERLPGGAWRARVKPAGRLRPGEVLELEEGRLRARLLERPRDAAGAPLPDWHLELEGSGEADTDPEVLLERFGRAPLPPYVARERGASAHEDRDSYQTVFAAHPGAIAAPTAGLHFTHLLLARLDQAGIERAQVTLHVGEGTFQPVSAEETGQHRMHAERYELPEATAAAVAACRRRGGRVVAVGTTSVRVLESCALPDGSLRPGTGSTDLFLVPGARFAVVDALLTNFHLPRSTLLMLVSAFAGRERVLALYAEAQREGYRFYSYGDAMLLE